jgi:hypothetical protein
MTTKQEMVAWISQATYEELLRKWRFEPAGSHWFRGEVGKYFEKMMQVRKVSEEVAQELMTGETPDVHVQASKKIGWDR